MVILLFQILIIMKTVFDYHGLETYCTLLRKAVAYNMLVQSSRVCRSVHIARRAAKQHLALWYGHCHLFIANAASELGHTHNN